MAVVEGLSFCFVWPLILLLSGDAGGGSSTVLQYAAAVCRRVASLWLRGVLFV